MPGEEYEMVQHWAEDFKLDNYFELIDENEFRTKRTDLEGLISSIEKDPFNFESNQKFMEGKMEKFQDSEVKLGVNPAVMWFMVDALKYFSDKPIEKIKETAHEIALLGTQGIEPGAKSKYKLQNAPGKDFSGYHLLAYYYVSWKIAIPEMVNKLNLPYDQEYVMAKQMFDGVK